MQLFLGSDVVYKERVAQLIKDALDKNGITGQTVPDSQFMNSVSWLSEQTVASALGRTAAGGTSTGNQNVTGLHGHGLTSTTIGTVTLQPEAPGVTNHATAGTNPTITVKFANQGDSDESDVKVSIELKGGGKDIKQTKTTSTKTKTDVTLNIPLGQQPPIGSPTTLTVAIGKVPGEKNLT